nr:immunoglobulin heavy chain junction region [Macaca mulatta]
CASYGGAYYYPFDSW